MQYKDLLFDDAKKLLLAILLEADKDSEYLVATIAKSANSRVLIFNSNTGLPRFYGYKLDRTPLFLMKKQIVSNAPRNSRVNTLLKARDIVVAELIMNGSWRQLKSQQEIVNWLSTRNWTANNTVHKDAEVIVVFRSKAQEYINQLEPDSKLGSNNANNNWPSATKREGNKFTFDTKNEIVITGGRLDLFKELFEARGEAVLLQELLKKSKASDPVRTLNHLISRIKNCETCPAVLIEKDKNNLGNAVCRIVYSPVS